MNMPYLGSAISTSSVVVLIATVFVVVLLCVAKIKKTQRLRPVAVLFSLYIIALVYVTTANNPSPQNIVLPPKERVDLLPLIDIINAIRYNIPYTYIQFLLNVVMFIPFGILLPALYKNMRAFTKVTAISFAITLSIEFIQWLLPESNRVFEINDLIGNVAGAIVGYSIWKLVMSVSHKPVILVHF